MPFDHTIPSRRAHVAALPEIDPSTQTMSSQEIADLTGKLPRNVVRDIRKTAKSIYGDCSTLSNPSAPPIPGIVVERDSRGFVSMVHLDRDHTMTVVTGYDIALRHRIMKRWSELERAVALPAQPAIPASYSDALRLAADNADEAERQRTLADERLKVIEAQAPAVAVIERISASPETVTITEAAKLLKVKAPVLFALMERRKWIFRRGARGRWQGAEGFLDSGHLEHHGFPVMTSSGPTEVYSVHVTMKGLRKLGELLVNVQLDLNIDEEGADAE